MTSAYQMLKSTPAKALNWDAFNDELIATFIRLREKAGHTYSRTIADWSEITGMSGKRRIAMEVSTLIIDDMSRIAVRIPATEETLTWGGFLGGTIDSYTDNNLANEALGYIEQVYRKHRVGASQLVNA